MSTYGAGAVDIKVGSATVVGSGTRFTSYIDANYIFRVRDESAFYVINTVHTATLLTLTAVYENINYNAGDTLTNRAYQIVTDYTPNRRFPEMTYNDTNISYIYTRAVRMIDNILAYNASESVLRFTKEVSASISGSATECSNGNITATSTEGVHIA